MTSNGKFVSCMLMLATLLATCILLTNMMPRLIAPLDDECTRMTPWAEPSALITPTVLLLGLGICGAITFGLLYAAARTAMRIILWAARTLRKHALPGAARIESLVRWLNAPRPAP